MGFLIRKSTLDQIPITKQITEKSHESDKDINLFYRFQDGLRFGNREKLKFNVLIVYT